MKRQVFTRILIIEIIFTLAMGLLTGCSKEGKVDYTIEGIAEDKQPQSDGGKSGLVQFQGEDDWKETWTIKTGEVEWDGKVVDVMADMSVDAKIITPKTDQMSVVEVVEPEFDADYKEKIVKSIFEEIYYGDFCHLPRKDLNKIRDSFNERRVIYSELPVDEEETEQEWKDLWDALDNIENAGDTYTPAKEYTMNKYIGTYEGRMYNLSFAEERGSRTFIRRVKQITMEPKDICEVCPEKFKEKKDLVYSPWILGDWVENHCQIAEEEALKEARLFAEKLGLDYSVVSTTLPLVWGNPPEVIPLRGMEETNDWEVNGYICSFDLGVDEISFVDFGMEEDYADFWTKSDRNEEIQYSLQARLQVYVTDQGVIKAVINNPMDIIGISEGVELLPLDTIQGIIRKEVAEQGEIFQLNYYTASYFNEMELIYFRVRDQESLGKYSYVPTWRLAAVIKDKTAHVINIRNPILINAIDGSVIDFYDET